MDIVERLRVEEARMLRLFDVASDFRDTHIGSEAAADFNAMRHAISGRDPILEPAAAEIERLRADNKRLRKLLERIGNRKELPDDQCQADSEGRL